MRILKSLVSLEGKITSEIYHKDFESLARSIKDYLYICREFSEEQKTKIKLGMLQLALGEATEMTVSFPHMIYKEYPRKEEVEYSITFKYINVT